MAKQTIGAASEDQIQAWKKKYPKGIFALEVEDDQGDTHITYVRKPDRKALSAAAIYAESDPIRSGETLFNTLRLGGSPKVIEDDELCLSVTAQIGNLFKLKQVEVKKL